MVLQVLHLGSSLVPMVLYILFLSLRLSNFFFLSRPKGTSSILLLPPYLQAHFSFLSLQLSCCQLNTQGYFSLLYRFPPPPILELCLLGIFSLFRLSQMYLMQPRLGKGSQIDVEVKIFNLLACSGSFIQFWASSRSYMWIIRVPRFK